MSNLLKGINNYEAEIASCTAKLQNPKLISNAKHNYGTKMDIAKNALIPLKTMENKLYHLPSIKEVLIINDGEPDDLLALLVALKHNKRVTMLTGYNSSRFRRVDQMCRGLARNINIIFDGSVVSYKSWDLYPNDAKKIYDSNMVVDSVVPLAALPQYDERAGMNINEALTYPLIFCCKEPTEICDMYATRDVHNIVVQVGGFNTRKILNNKRMCTADETYASVWRRICEKIIIIETFKSFGSTTMDMSNSGHIFKKLDTDGYLLPAICEWNQYMFEKLDNELKGLPKNAGGLIPLEVTLLCTEVTQRSIKIYNSLVLNTYHNAKMQMIGADAVCLHALFSKPQLIDLTGYDYNENDYLVTTYNRYSGLVYGENQNGLKELIDFLC